MRLVCIRGLLGPGIGIKKGQDSLEVWGLNET